jgi:hypothetical protein
MIKLKKIQNNKSQNENNKNIKKKIQKNERQNGTKNIINLV